MKNISIKKLFVILFINIVITACGSDNNNNDQLVSIPTAELTASEILKKTIIEESSGLGLSAFILPASDDLDNIPQDMSNPLTTE